MQKTPYLRVKPKPYRQALSLSVATLSGLCATASLAQTDAILPTVRITGQSPVVNMQGARSEISLDPAKLPSALSVVTAEELGTINVGRDISNIFRRVSGVVANNIDQGDTGNGFRMRGFATGGTHGADTAVYVDGMPQNMPSSEAGAGHGPAFLEWLTPDMIERVTVIKGPVSALFGDQNRAGAVDIRTRSGPQPSSAALTLESFNGRRGTLVLSGQLFADQVNPIQSLFVADVYRAGSFRDNSSNKRDNLMLKLSAQRDDALYSLRLNYYRTDYQAPGYLSYSRLAAGLVAPTSKEENALPGYGNGHRTAVVFNRAPAQGEAGLYATVYAEDFQRVRGGIAGGLLHNEGSDDRTILGGRLAYNWVFGNTGALQAGADVRSDQGDGIRRRFTSYTPTANYLTNLDMDLLTWGLFAQGQYKLAPNIKLLAGGRLDSFDYEITNRKLPAASTGYRKSVFTPKLGAVWSVSPQLDVFANAAEGFRSASAQQISPSGALGPLGAIGGKNNAGIEPTKVRSYDVGFTATPAAGVSLSAAAYYTLNQDEIVLVAPDTFQSVGSTTRKGFELEGRWRASPAWSAYASYNRILKAQVNNPLPGIAPQLSVPKDQLKAGVEYKTLAGAGRMTVNADLYYTACNPFFSGTPLVQGTMPLYTRYDFKVTYDWQKYQLSGFVVLQPQRNSSEAAFATTAGLQVSPNPKQHVGVSLRYFFE